MFPHLITGICADAKVPTYDDDIFEGTKTKAIVPKPPNARLLHPVAPPPTSSQPTPPTTFSTTTTFTSTTLPSSSSGPTTVTATLTTPIPPPTPPSHSTHLPDLLGARIMADVADKNRKWFKVLFEHQRIMMAGISEVLTGKGVKPATALEAEEPDFTYSDETETAIEMFAQMSATEDDEESDYEEDEETQSESGDDIDAGVVGDPSGGGDDMDTGVVGRGVVTGAGTLERAETEADTAGVGAPGAEPATQDPVDAPALTTIAPGGDDVSALP